MTKATKRNPDLLRSATCIIILVASAVANGSFYKLHYTKAHQDLHQLVRQTTHSHLQDFEIALPEFFGRINTQHGRKKRDILSQDHVQRFKISSHAHDFDVELSPNTQFLSRDFSVERIGNGFVDGERRKEQLQSAELECHQTGRMISHDNRTTAISTCRGLTGFLRTNEDDFIIEPVPSRLSHDFPDSDPHIVYKARDLRKKDDHVHVCGKQRYHPIPTDIGVDFEMRELSNGQVIFVRESEKTRDERKRSRKRHKRGDPIRIKHKRKIVETLVVADHHLVRKHLWGLSDVTTYVLTVMNMVSSLFKDASLDEHVDIVIVGLKLLEDDKEFHLDDKVDKSLAKFCRWQAKLNTTSGRKPDHAILITGSDICVDKDQPCDTLGLAQLGGMCSASSCTINEDSGLGLAFTIAHETGHSFGMTHDGVDNSCDRGNGHIMSPSLRTTNGVFTWSACSRKSMEMFFRTERSKCLDDEPLLVDAAFPEELPGQQYNGTLQCQLQYGMDAQLCEARYYASQGYICKALWCLVDFTGICTTKNIPAAEGTACGRNKWCRRGQCVSRDTTGPQPVDGGWSRYDAWSDCSRTCGRGISYKQRFCSEPTPLYGGRLCEGEEKTYRICNPQECPPIAQSYRAEQCARYNSRPYRRQNFTWIPFTKFWKYDFNRCELFCEAEGSGFFDRLSSQVIDGTSCDENTNDVCIEGQCEHVGCDFVFNSNATVDACGVCNGDNSTCNFLSGTLTKRLDSGYHHVVTIPQGARTVSIWEEHCCTRAYIAARSATNRSSYFLNGHWRVDHYGINRFAGATWTYERPSHKGDILITNGPLIEDVVIEVLIVTMNPGVSFSYAVQAIENTLPHDPLENPQRHSYSWKEGFSLCSKSCGGGIQRSTSECVEDGEDVVIDSYCDGVNRQERRSRKCNTQLCPARWVPEEWGACSRTCGGGVQVRRISCERESQAGNVNVHQRECILSPKVKRSRSCGREPCLPKWTTTRWTKCVRNCDRGVRTRLVSCRSGMRRLPYAKCDRNSRPANRQPCSSSSCRMRFSWSLSSWSSCSSSCGQGQQYRTLKCTYKDTRPVHHQRCRSSSKPRAPLRRSCSITECSRDENVPTTRPGTTIRSTRRPLQQTTPRSGSRRAETRRPRPMSEWISTTWQVCTRSCGGGQQVRAVKCMQDGQSSVGCSYETKPPNIRACNTQSCSGGNDSCEDSHSWCHMAPRHNTCSHVIFGRQCCKSCKNSTKPKTRQ